MTTQPQSEPAPGLDLLAFAKLLKERHSRHLTPDLAELEPPALAKRLEKGLAQQLPDPKREFELPALAKLLTEGQERPASEIVAELDKPTPTMLAKLQWDLLSPEQRDVGIGIVAAERKRPNISESGTETEALGRADKQPYLDLIVDVERQEIQRHGYSGRVILSGSVAWPMFLAVFNAKGAPLTRQQVANLPGEGQAARRNTKGRINEKLKTFAVAIPDNEWRLVDFSKP